VESENSEAAASDHGVQRKVSPQVRSTPQTAILGERKNAVCAGTVSGHCFRVSTDLLVGDEGPA